MLVTLGALPREAMVATSQSTLLTLSDDILLHMVVALGPVDTFRLGCVATALQHLHSPHVWRLLLEHTFGDVTCVQSVLGGSEDTMTPDWKHLFISLAFGQRHALSGCPLLAEPDADGAPGTRSVHDPLRPQRRLPRRTFCQARSR